MRYPAFFLVVLLLSCSSSKSTNLSLSTPEKFFQQLFDAVNKNQKENFENLCTSRADCKRLTELNPDESISSRELEKLLDDYEEISRKTCQKSFKDLISVFGTGKGKSFKLNKYEIITSDGIPAVNKLSATVEMVDGSSRTITVGRIILIDGNWKSTMEITVI